MGLTKFFDDIIASDAEVDELQVGEGTFLKSFDMGYVDDNITISGEGQTADSGHTFLISISSQNGGGSDSFDALLYAFIGIRDSNTVVHSYTNLLASSETITVSTTTNYPEFSITLDRGTTNSYPNTIVTIQQTSGLELERLEVTD